VTELAVATAADAPRITELLNEISRGHYGEADLTEAEVTSWFGFEKLEVLLAEQESQTAVAYGDRYRQDERDRSWLDVRALDGHADAGALLLAALERRSLPDIDPGGRAMTWVASVDDGMRGVVETAGYDYVRSSFRMTIQLGELTRPEWPDGITVSPYDGADEKAVHAAHQEAFRDHWEHRDEPFDEWREWMVETPSFDPSLWFVARDGDEIAGVSLCRVSHSGDESHGHCSVLAVRRPWRRRGLGLALLRHSFVEMAQRGMTRASLGVDAENLTGAVALYERAGMQVERRNDCWQKQLK
jgi:mycothiol synthase